MATSSRELRQQRLAQKSEHDLRSPERAPVDLQTLEQGQDLSPEMATQLAPQLGNLALQDLLAGGQVGTAARSGADQGEEEEQVEELAESEDIAEDQALDGVQFGGGGGGGGGGTGGDPWDVGRLFGGDDDDDEPNRPRARPKHKRRPELDDEEDDFFDDEPEEFESVEAEHVEPADRRLGAVEQGERLLDARYPSVEEALTDPQRLARPGFSAEDLVHSAGAAGPLGRPAHIGAFLAEAATSSRARSLGHLVSRGLAGLCPEGTGYAGSVARVAALTVCALAAEGGGAPTDRAVRLALADGAWDEAVQAARPLSRRGRLRSPLIIAQARAVPLDPPSSERIPTPSPLALAAIHRVLPRSTLAEVPRLDLDALLPQAPDDPSLAEVDALLNALTGGPDPDAEPRLDREAIAPLLRTARTLMNSVGRAYVEFAAGALAVLAVRPDAPVRGPVVSADRALRDLARATLRSGRTLEQAVGYRLEDLDAAELEASALGLQHVLDALEGLRSWTFDRLAGSLDA